MLIKAMLTGGVLSILAGSIVYFGAEGAGALDRDSLSIDRVDLSDFGANSIDETDLAGGADVAVRQLDEVETAPPPKEEPKPKTRWLDQYLKSTKSKGDEVEEVEIERVETDTDDVDGKPSKAEKKIVKRIVIKTEKDGEATWASNSDDVDIDDVLEMEVVRDVLKGQDIDEADVRVLRLNGKKMGGSLRVDLPSKVVDYAAVLEEAQKLQVTDMRNDAMFEILDYAIDRGDFDEAKMVVDELSSPELRDTARARIGKSLATRGDMRGAFSLLDDIEIDELAAPIRLEVIAALMATRDERESASSLGR